MKPDTQDSLDAFLGAWDNEDLPDGAWWAMLEEGVEAFNLLYRTHLDPNEAVLGYVERKSQASL